MLSYIGFTHIVLCVFAASATTQLHKPISRILVIRGERALQNTHTHMAGLIKGHKRHRQLFCGGSIIGKKTILTAAHCVEFVFFDGALDRNLRVSVGTTQRKSGGTLYEVSRNVTHPKYLPGPIKNDIALLITSNGILFNHIVSYIKLDYNFHNENVRAKVAGWGITEKGFYADNLMELIVKTISGEKCLAEMPTAIKMADTEVKPFNPDIEICTIQPPGRGTCKVDSGSPLVRTDTHKQIGIVSWGLNCAKGAPDVYVKISAYKDWIEKHLV